MAPVRRSCAFLLLSVGLLACDRPPSATLAEWTPRDHEQKEQTAKQQGKGKSGQGTGDALVEATWRNQCMTCHGPIGKGDGPTGPMVKAADLTDPAWQAKVTDEQLAQSIRKGKGKMPQFDLSEPVVKGLIARIRTARGQ